MVVRDKPCYLYCYGSNPRPPCGVVSHFTVWERDAVTNHNRLRAQAGQVHVYCMRDRAAEEGYAAELPVRVVRPLGPRECVCFLDSTYVHQLRTVLRIWYFFVAPSTRGIDLQYRGEVKSSTQFSWRWSRWGDIVPVEETNWNRLLSTVQLPIQTPTQAEPGVKKVSKVTSKQILPF